LWDGFTIASPLPENADGDVAEKSIASRFVLEQRPIIPPSLVCSVHLQQLFVFVQLQFHPLAIRVSVAVVLGEHVLRLLLLVVDVHPSWGFREEVCGAKDDAGKQQLDPDDQLPSLVPRVICTASCYAACDDRSSEPK